jgi:hypothetical protein
MRSSPWSADAAGGLRRRTLLLAGAGAPLAALATDVDVAAALRAGGVVAAVRHALAPGTFDPPEFRLGDCSTQRNLNDDGRAQARRLGEWFRSRGLEPAAVRSSPWCRCVDTAQLAFGRHEVWEPLSSPHRADPDVRERRLQALRAGLAAVPAGRFEVWVTHNFVLGGLAGESAASGGGVLLKAAPDGARPLVLARLDLV